MTTFAKKALIAAVAALTLGTADIAISTPASAHGGGGFGGFGLFHAFGDMSDSSNSGNVYDASGTPARGVACHNEKQKLYDDDDNVVGTRVVQVCPLK